MIHHHLRLALVFGTSLLILFLGGCSSYRPPSIQLMGVTIAEESDEAITLSFELELQNPNTEPIELREFRYEVSLNGQVVYSGRRAAGTTLHSRSVQHLNLPGVARYELLGWTRQTRPRIVDYQLSGTLLYLTPGELAEILLDTGVRRPTVNFSQVGQLTLVGER